MEELIEFIINPVIKIKENKIVHLNPMAKEFFTECIKKVDYDFKRFIENNFGYTALNNIEKILKEEKEEQILQINEETTVIIKKNITEGSYIISFFDISYQKINEDICNTISDIILITTLDGRIVYKNKASLILFSGNEKKENKIDSVFEIDTQKIVEEINKKGNCSLNLKTQSQYGKTSIYMSFIIKYIKIKEKKYLLFFGKNITELLEYQKILFEYLKNQTVVMESFEILIKNKNIIDITKNIERKLIKELNIKGVEFIDSGKSMYSSNKTEYFYDINFSPSLYPDKKIVFRIYFDNIKFLIENLHIKETLLYIFTNVFNTYEKILFIEKLKEERDRALEADRLKSSFLSNLSHEIRTPLNGIIGFLQILENESKRPDLIEYINTIKESSERLIRNIENILYLSKLETEKPYIKEEEVIIEDIVYDIAKKYTRVLNSKNIEMEISSETEPTRIIIDKEKIRKILIEVIDNAIKFTENGKVKIKIDKTQSELIITVKNTGESFPEEIKNKVFTYFFQYQTKHTKKPQGLGIGLPIVKKLVSILKGKIDIETQETGTKVTIKLPKERN